MSHIPDPEYAKAACADLSKCIQEHRKHIEDVLRSVESQETIDDELFKSLDALHNVDREAVASYAPVGDGAVFLPVNLPLYSLVLFGVLPGLFADRVWIRPAERMRSVIAGLIAILAADTRVQRLKLCQVQRREFIDTRVSTSAFVIYTGRLHNAHLVRSALREDQLLLFNGQGVNPVVVAPDADLQVAVRKTCDVKRFNSGQDCASPDVVLVHDTVYDSFVESLCHDVDRITIGSYADGADVGPLLEPKQVLFAANHLHEWQRRIVSGGSVCLKRGIVQPTIVTSSLEDGRVNRTELFAPIWHVCRYKDDEELREFFEHPHYRQHAMYLTLFGSSRYIDTQKHTTVLREHTVMEAERGYLEYGGSALGASFVQFRGATAPRPILVSREIRRAFPVGPYCLDRATALS